MRGRVLSGDQQRERVADDFLVGERAVLALGGEHRLEEVLGLLEQLRALAHPCAGLLDEAGDRAVEFTSERSSRRSGGSRNHRQYGIGKKIRKLSMVKTC